MKDLKDFKSTGLICKNDICRKIGKKGCFRELCKRCCNKTENLEIEKEDELITLKNSQLSNHQKCSKRKFHICTVHKSSLKEIEKMKMKKKEFNSFLQNQKIDQEVKYLDSDIIRENFKSKGELDENSNDSIENRVLNRMGLDTDIINNSKKTPSKEDLIKDNFFSLLQSQNESNHENCLPSASLKTPYKSACLALLIGIGADEQMVK